MYPRDHESAQIVLGGVVLEVVDPLRHVHEIEAPDPFVRFEQPHERLGTQLIGDEVFGHIVTEGALPLNDRIGIEPLFGMIDPYQLIVLIERFDLPFDDQSQLLWPPSDLQQCRPLRIETDLDRRDQLIQLRVVQFTERADITQKGFLVIETHGNPLIE